MPGTILDQCHHHMFVTNAAVCTLAISNREDETEDGYTFVRVHQDSSWVAEKRQLAFLAHLLMQEHGEYNKYILPNADLHKHMTSFLTDTASSTARKLRSRRAMTTCRAKITLTFHDRNLLQQYADDMESNLREPRIKKRLKMLDKSGLDRGWHVHTVTKHSAHAQTLPKRQKRPRAVAKHTERALMGTKHPRHTHASTNDTGHTHAVAQHSKHCISKTHEVSITRANVSNFPEDDATEACAADLPAAVVHTPVSCQSKPEDSCFYTSGIVRLPGGREIIRNAITNVRNELQELQQHEHGTQSATGIPDIHLRAKRKNKSSARVKSAFENSGRRKRDRKEEASLPTCTALGIEMR